MNYQERINELINRIEGYPLHEVVVELLVLWVVVYLVVRFMRGTRGARVAKGIALLLITATPAIRLIGSETEFERLNFLYAQFVTFAALTLVIVFQPELRRALVRLGESRIFRGGSLRTAQVIDELIASVSYLSRNKIGALIVLERQVGVEATVVGGTPLDAQVSRDLLNTIFWPGSALHDMAVVIREDRIVAAAVQLPLAEGEAFTSELGSRHRAAVGLTQETDALAITVSEETGIISVAEKGHLIRGFTPETLHAALLQALGQRPTPLTAPVAAPTNTPVAVPLTTTPEPTKKAS
ncbi:MAG: diadenylate cyclase CdaA [Planctomycetota bacterium]|nr:diadenylate cyclase CdaA [Planctomycetota bacterium]